MLRGAAGQSHTTAEHEEVGAVALEERVRVAAPDGRVAEVDGVTGRRYRATGGGLYEMHPRDAKALLREGGFVPSVGGVTRGGYQCPVCGFMAVVRTCSRCACAYCETKAERAARENAERWAAEQDDRASFITGGAPELRGGVQVGVVRRGPA